MWDGDSTVLLTTATQVSSPVVTAKPPLEPVPQTAVRTRWDPYTARQRLFP